MREKTLALVLALTMTQGVSAFAAEETVPPANPPLTVEVQGEALDLSGKEPYIENGMVMVPVRAIGEAVGYTVTWTAERPNEAGLDNGVVRTTIYMGVDSYFMASSTAIGMSAPTPLGAAPKAENGVTHVPMELFALLGNGVTRQENVISFTKEGNPMTQIPNPMKRYESIEAAAEAAGITPGKLPNVPPIFDQVAAYTIGGTMLHVDYRGGDSRIVYRVEAGDRDISGDYRVYSETKTETINGLTITTKGDEGFLSLATWTAAGYSYALSSTPAMSADTLAALLAD